MLVRKWLSIKDADISKNIMEVFAPLDIAGRTVDTDESFRVDYKLLYQADLPDEYHKGMSATFKTFRKLKDSLESNFIAKHFSSEIFGVTPKVAVYPVVARDNGWNYRAYRGKANALETRLIWHFNFEVPPATASGEVQEQAKKAFDANIKNANKLVNRLIDVEQGYYEFASDEQPEQIEGFDLDGFEMDLQNFYDSAGLAKKEPKKQFAEQQVSARWAEIIK